MEEAKMLGEQMKEEEVTLKVEDGIIVDSSQGTETKRGDMFDYVMKKINDKHFFPLYSMYYDEIIDFEML
jgi:hypothetical protein